MKIANGRLDANLTEMALYSGAGTGAIAIDGASATPAIGASFKLAGVDALAFLTDVMGFKRIEGTGSFAFDLQASGKSQSALTQSLSGKGSMDVKNGAIRGVNIPKMLQSLSVQTVLGWQPSNDKTEFSQMGATFTVDKGIVTNQDLVVAGKAFQLAGAGTIDLPAETISYRHQRQGRRQGRQAPGLRRPGADRGAAVEAQDLPRRPGHPPESGRRAQPDRVHRRRSPGPRRQQG